MRRDNTNNSFEAKRIARQAYAERQIAKWYKWSFETKGRIKYNDLMKTIATFTKNE